MIFMRSNLKIFLLLVLLTFITYLNILPNNLFFDDEELIYKNTYIQNIKYLPLLFTENMIAGSGKISNMYRPILMTTFAVDHAFWGNNPFGYHLSSLILHAANGILVFYLINQLFKHQLLSLFTSVMFAVHPIQSEAVSYASGRTDPLYTFFFLLSLIFFVKGKTISVIIFFLLSLLSKETAIILPLILLLIYHLLEKNNKRKTYKLVLLSATFISFIYIFLRLTVLNFANTLNFYQTGNIYSQNLSVRFYTFTKVFFEYLSLIFYPKELMIARSATVITSITDLYVLSFILLFILGLFLSIKFYKKDPLYLFSFAWFFITILPVSGIIPINNIMAEHYLYLPSLSFFLLIAKLFTFLWQKFPGHTQRLVISLLIIAIIITLSGRTITRTFDWRNPIIFYTKSLAQSPENLPMRNNLAMAYSERNMLEEAIREYKATIEIGDIYPNTHHNLANVYKQQGKYKEAEEEYLKALEIDPKFYFSYGGLADLYQITGDKVKLEKILNKIK